MNFNLFFFSFVDHAFGISLFECSLSLITYFKHLLSISGGTAVSSFPCMFYSSEISLFLSISLGWKDSRKFFPFVTCKLY